MAIKPSKTVSKSIESHVRIKQLRDYTIPVRLNQLSSSITATEVTPNGSPDRRSADGEHEADSFLLSVAKSKLKLQQHKHSRRIQRIKTTQSIKMIDEISTTFKSTQRSLQTPIECSKMTLVAAIALLTISAKICHCDTQQQPTSLQDSSSSSSQTASSLLSSSLASSAPEAVPPQAAAAPSSTTAATSASSKSQPLVSGSHREHLLSVLSDSIERQHFKIKPVRAFVQHQRPSKFDSGDDFVGNELSEVAANFIQKASNRTRQQQAGLSTLKKNDDSMMQILRMHEQLAKQQSPTTIKSNNRPTLESSESSSSSANGLVGKWRELTRAPARVASNLINPNKMVSSVLSYITPLVGPKLLDYSPILGVLKPSLLQLNSSSTRFRLNPFVGRSNNQASIAASLFGSQQQSSAVLGVGDSSSLPSASPIPAAASHQYSFAVTGLPLTSYLSKPEKPVVKSAVASGFDNNSGQQNQAYAPTQPTTRFFKNLIDASDSLTKSSESKIKPPDMYSKDLIMADSNSQSSMTLFSTSDSGETQKSNAIKQEPSTKGGLRGTGSRLKASANQMAQNYIQDSFRGFLTLSQLPILSERPTSTAPSVFEKKMNIKQQRPSTTNQLSTDIQTQNHGKRALEELYRLGYILATGVRRKKDPLLALESSSGTSVSPIKNSLKKGVFSQRALGQLLAANRNQILTYARRLRSSLAKPGGLQSSNKFKPRGVMWDMATDPSLAVTVFHLLERASVALPLEYHRHVQSTFISTNRSSYLLIDTENDP